MHRTETLCGWQVNQWEGARAEDTSNCAFVRRRREASAAWSATAKSDDASPRKMLEPALNTTNSPQDVPPHDTLELAANTMDPWPLRDTLELPANTMDPWPNAPVATSCTTFKAAEQQISRQCLVLETCPADSIKHAQHSVCSYMCISSLEDIFRISVCLDAWMCICACASRMWPRIWLARHMWPSRWAWHLLHDRAQSV